MKRSMFIADDREYLTAFSTDRITVTCRNKAVFDYEASGITGAAFNGRRLYYTVGGKSGIFSVSPDGGEERFTAAEGYESVILLRPAVNAREILVLEAAAEGKTEYVVFDAEKGKKLFVLPVHSGFIDLAAVGENRAYLLCEEETNCSVYEDDDDYSVLFCLEFSYDEEGRISPSGKICLHGSYDNFDDRYIEIFERDGGMKFPLFDLGLRHWLNQKSLTQDGKYAVYYCRDISGIIVGNRLNGDVYRIFALPEGMADPEADFYYNSCTDVLTVIRNDEAAAFEVKSCPAELLEQLNQIYDDCFYKRKVPDDSEEFRFSVKHLMMKAVEQTVCTPV